MTLIFVDVEAPFGIGSPAIGNMTEFGAVEYKSKETFHGKDHWKKTFVKFRVWLSNVSEGRPVFISDNIAYDWQWINYYFWKYFGDNPFGHSGRRISDFYAGLCNNFYKTQEWKKYRVTKHDHNPVHDAMGNVEAFEKIVKIYKLNIK